jgi:hypothetical protein
MSDSFLLTTAMLSSSARVRFARRTHASDGSTVGLYFTMRDIRQHAGSTEIKLFVSRRGLSSSSLTRPGWKGLTSAVHLS